MKINEAFEGLLKNKDSVYETKLGPFRSELSLCKSGFFYLKIYDNLGKEIDSSLGGGGFNGNITAEDEWKLVREPVDFMTAIKAYEMGKTIKCDTEGIGTRIHKPDHNNILVDNRKAPITTNEIINGKWLIE